ncbi:RagB/SusD family nutrient uptake outer membrane protein [Flavobacteriaceae bacterium F89]|uniref:RagB/SusD family nutrient uptake outer membrane protein n=1 Tax=Cerina litoralis TaxID=2874477 RepID=A0AAE3EVG2_9FLAO|nr:RagB/SusD family nutrient uptake outer membrane protein [Cerina litoralis]MCG2461678.1 RagB/SusD family nutrient uptake outer membrane protein [Cerina litoralis]
MKKTKYLLSGVLGLLLLASCEKLDLAPENQFTDLTYWTSAAKAQAMLNTAYSQMFSSQNFFYNEATSDNAYNGRGDTAGAASLAAGNYDSSLGRFEQEWKDRYSGIKSCNILLENIDRITDMDENLRNRMKAETRFIRAFQHFQLMTWFGDVPLLKSDISIEEAQAISRTPRAEVLQFVLDELDDVEAILPKNTEYSTDERGKVTRGAAIALKARVLLYEGRWEEVAITCEKLINTDANGTYALFPSYSGLFLPENQYSSEDILSLQYVPVDRTWGEFFDFAPLSAGSRLNAMAATQELVDAYLMINGKAIKETGSGYDENDPYVNRDPRLTNTIVYDGYEWKEPATGDVHTIYIKPGSSPDNPVDEYSPGSSATPTGYYLRKYYDPNHETGLASGLNLMLIRYADVLLMYAEAKNELGQLNQDVWDKTIKALRSRAGFTDAPALNYDGSLSQADFRTIIRNERRVELAMEGLRIFDIRRWKTAETVLNGWAHGARFGPSSQDNGYIRANLRSFDPSKHYLWPIPRDERQINPNLTQNPGW